MLVLSSSCNHKASTNDSDFSLPLWGKTQVIIEILKNRLNQQGQIFHFSSALCHSECWGPFADTSLNPASLSKYSVTLETSGFKSADNKGTRLIISDCCVRQPHKQLSKCLIAISGVKASQALLYTKIWTDPLLIEMLSGFRKSRLHLAVAFRKVQNKEGRGTVLFYE